MKTILTCLFILLSICIYGQNFKKLDDKSIDSKQMESSRKFANEYFAKQVSGSYYQFKKGEAIDEMITALTAEKQKQVYNQLIAGFGPFKSLEYAQAWLNANAKLTVYRFKSIFGDSAKLEIRVVINDKGQIAGFFIKPWTENLQ